MFIDDIEKLDSKDYFSIKRNLIEGIFNTDAVVTVNGNLYAFCGSREFHVYPYEDDSFRIEVQMHPFCGRSLIKNIDFSKRYSPEVLLERYTKFLELYNRDLLEEKFSSHIGADSFSIL